jgi:hypothetical protein
MGLHREGREAVKYSIGQGIDRFWVNIAPEERRGVRWTYRTLRVGGADRGTARLAMHTMFHVGARTGLK